MVDGNETFADGLLVWKELHNQGNVRTQLPHEIKVTILRAIRQNDIINRGAGDQQIKSARQALFTALGLDDPAKDVKAATNIKKKITAWMDNQILQLKKDQVFKVHGDYVEWADYTSSWLHESWNGQTKPPRHWTRRFTYQEIVSNLAREAQVEPGWKASEWMKLAEICAAAARSKQSQGLGIAAVISQTIGPSSTDFATQGISNNSQLTSDTVDEQHLPTQAITHPHLGSTVFDHAIIPHDGEIADSHRSASTGSEDQSYLFKPLTEADTHVCLDEASQTQQPAQDLLAVEIARQAEAMYQQNEDANTQEVAHTREGAQTGGDVQTDDQQYSHVPGELINSPKHTRRRKRQSEAQELLRRTKLKL